MALKKTVRKAVRRALIAFDDLAGDLTLQYVDESSYDPVTGDLPAPATSTFKGILDDYTDEEIDGSIVTKTDKRGYLWPRDDGLEPESGWQLLDPTNSDIVYTIMNPQRIKPFDETFLFELQLRA